MEVAESDPVSLRAVPGDELARRLTTLARAGEMDSKDWHAVQDELARRRVAATRRPVPPTESLRTQILTHLAKAPGAPSSQIAKALDRSTTVVSRVLSTLLEAGLVTYETTADDGRVRQYHLTTPDTVTADGTVKPPSDVEEERQYLGLVIAAAVRARRRANDLDYAADRLGRVLEQATTAGADDLALLARRELVTTLRQARRFDDVDQHLAAFREIAAGNTNIEPHLVAPATAYLDYELGRRQHADVLVGENLEHLTTAATIFRRCRDLDQAHDWSPREGWARLASAELLRQQTEFGAALANLRLAESIFIEYDDTYGTAEATRIQGFCLRLRGDFIGAIEVLQRAEKLAKESSSDRSRADILLQLGDSWRCTGELKLAEEYLTEAASLASDLKRTHTLGFSLSALAAVQYASEDLDQAWKLATDAAPLLESSVPGRALTARRRAVILRDLDGGPAKLRQSVAYFHESMEQYYEMGSPAGIAACCIGLGRIGDRGARPEDATKRLVKVSRSTDGRLLLPIDPWIPSLVHQAADKSDSADLRRVADETSTDGKELGVADEMAGEPRQRSALRAA
jgi:tetratricopeptide (TPR) repeat protein